ncbi:hypothetical protein A3C32_01245 [Candidatus Daviesbacteria bacterium RIFCSPHIGHO2_02_FULL_41_14]|uniref:LytR/CpsA/Psr regulator C-terminal domain-containing protein n=1 Tax=Candidatus Daviesbacteria bacterium RIFCSPLOWO2_01_FULL_40_24 TaxID=1797787 RepID=A0A1F5MK43_9BACT|nr:MAG: hypothetical protein A2780_02375 [Candidatus Daviesbacteria bacterium RIFCSPHIGHO2_01_FULL_41_45]OGE35025.1 MAG: hypothetical protein A3C32_01245 [Candidatus Daviesbacteria bacterium RIFCSPHIGHO2_02_FULL_41_14]OGE65732.1 MAG: hypothetical protein A3B49_02655 [Candidatus Daviesbacteria bacterium RIFCSPLOWO2_01_FULL_40_24]
MTKTARKHSKTSWKKFQSDGQQKKRLYLGLIVLGVIVITVLLGKVLSFVGALGQPFSPDGESTGRSHLWNFISPINLIIKSDKVSLLSYNPSSKSLTIVKIPDETYLQASLGYGKWPARSIYQLGQTEGKKIGAELLKLTITETMGVPIDGYLVFQGDSSNKGVDAIVEDLRSSPFTTLGMISDIKTDLSLWELLRLIMEVRGVRFDKIDNKDLSQSQTTSWTLLSDGRRALEINQSLLDKELGSYLIDESLSLEGISVAIYNSTDHPKLAEKAARVVTNMGGRVVLTSVIKPRLEDSVIIGSSSYSYTRLGKIFAPNCFKKSCKDQIAKISEENNSLKTLPETQLTIILGEDYYKKYNNL